MSDTIAIDKVLVSILQRRLKSITEEMSIAMTRTTRSPILCEAKDFVTGLYDAQGNILEQTENLPILAFSLAPVCRYIIGYYGDDIHPGDDGHAAIAAAIGPVLTSAMSAAPGAG